MKLAIVGSRGVLNYKLFKKVLNQLPVEHIISGGARGADSLAHKYASDNGLPITIYYPDWDNLGKSRTEIKPPFKETEMQTENKKNSKAASAVNALVRATCDCEAGIDPYGYDGKDQRAVKIPGNLDIRYNAPGRDKRESVTLDACIIPEIKFLWEQGVKTGGCCCGHKGIDGMILVDDESIEKMEDLGYEHWENPMDSSRRDGFYAKTCRLS